MSDNTNSNQTTDTTEQVDTTKTKELKAPEKEVEYRYSWTFDKNIHDKCGSYSTQIVSEKEFNEMVEDSKIVKTDEKDTDVIIE